MPILVAFDVETTGKSPDLDQIIEISICLYDESPEPHVYHTYVKPEVEITPGAFRVHGIGPKKLEDAPRFAEVADEIEALFRSAEVVLGYNVRFDIRFLEREFERIGRSVDLESKTVVDPYRVWQAMEPRKLENAFARFAGGSLTNAHSAKDDALAVMDVLEGMRKAFGLQDVSMEELAALSDPDRVTWIGPSSHIRWEGDDVVMGFGKYDGRRLLDVARDDPGYLRWIQDKDFPVHVRNLCKGALAGHAESAFKARLIEFFGAPPEPATDPEG